LNICTEHGPQHPISQGSGLTPKRAVYVHLTVNSGVALVEGEPRATKSDENTFFAPCFCKARALKYKAIGQRTEETAKC
tara:strand:+ start:2313 stop:2549 length:237 start_codon:yes stop_codon:yes gene_type:complete